jgi:PAP2 superfamily
VKISIKNLVNLVFVGQRDPPFEEVKLCSILSVIFLCWMPARRIKLPLIENINQTREVTMTTTSETKMSILCINDLALQLVANDFSKNAPPPASNDPTNGGPTKTSRALAIIHLAAHDAYAKVTEKLTPQLKVGLPDKPSGLSSEEDGIIALLGAGIRAAVQIYPDQSAFIASEATKILKTVTNPRALRYGEQIADIWVNARKNDGSAVPQFDDFFDTAPGRHRPDPLQPGQKTLGRTWGLVTPFVLGDVKKDAPLTAPYALTSYEYAQSFNEVITCGKSDTALSSDPAARMKALIGIFWGYDGVNKLGTPPRLYNQVVRKIAGFDDLVHSQQVKLLTAINVAMADAGIAAWYWKYEYDFWRPVLGIREADSGFGPTGNGDGNANTTGDPFWLPLGAPNSNPPAPVFGAKGSNITPPFPAYPSGHSTFGSACFEVAAAILCKETKDVHVTFISDEFNGVTTDNSGATRPKWSQTFSLKDAIEQNGISRIYLGVHWSFDATGGATVGNAVAEKVVAAFR